MNAKKTNCGCDQRVPVADLLLGNRRVYARLERETPSGSHKDYAGRFIVEDKRRRGEIHQRRLSRFLVPSSGNFGHSFATHTRDDHVKVVIVTDVLSPKPLRDRFRDDYNHVEVELVDDPDDTGSHMRARLELIEKLRRDDPRLILVDQYSDARIPRAYEMSLINDMYRQMHEDLAAVFVAVGTGGLANGLHQFRERFQLNFQIFAVDADGSCLARPPKHGGRRRLSGYGNGIAPPLMSEVRAHLDRWVFVQDEEAVEMCHRMRDQHGTWVGPSSGAVLAAFEKIATWRSHLLPKSGHVVAILSDGGEVYRDTVFNAAWLERNGLGEFLQTQTSKTLTAERNERRRTAGEHEPRSTDSQRRSSHQRAADERQRHRS